MGTATQTDGDRSETPRAWSMTAARDRISSTLFMAALLHGIVILGVTFGTGGGDFEPATSLDVVLVLDTQTAEQAPENARVLAQSNLDGSGNTTENVPLQTASARSADAPGPQRPGERETQRVGSMQQAPLVMSTAPGSPNSRKDELGEPVPRAMARSTALPGDSSQVELIDEAATQTIIADENPRELVISASTRESRIAAYLSNWKRKVERVGTLNFPRQADAQAGSRYPTLEVAIGADGRLQEVVVRNSSGEQVLDQAAMDILRIAAPFDAFPEFLRADYDVLRFAYEWRFGPDAGVQRLSARSAQ